MSSQPPSGVLKVVTLSYLECHECQCCKKYADNPETCHYFRLRYGSQRESDECVGDCVSCLLEVMMKRCHLEHTFSRTATLAGVLEVGYLYYHRQVFNEEDKTQQWNEKFLAYQDCEYGKYTSDCKTACVTQ